MKDGVLYLVGLAILAGGIFMYRSNIDPFHPWQSQNTVPEFNSRVAAPLTPTARAAEPPQRAHISQSSRVAEESAAINRAPVAEPKAPELPKAKTPTPPFPSLDQIEAGSRDEAITAKYGSPAVSTLTSDSGRVIETFIYTRDRGHSATVIRLEDGKVARAYTSGPPAPPSGLSAPPRWRNQ